MALSVCALAQVKVSGDRISVNTSGTSLVLNARVGQQLRFVYFGTKLSDNDIDALMFSGSRPMNAYPVYGQGEICEDALAVTHSDGNMSLDMAGTFRPQAARQRTRRPLASP